MSTVNAWLRKCLVLVPLAVAAAFIGKSCAAQTLRVVHDQRFPPFASVEQGKSQGLAVDILEAAAKRAGITISFVPVPFKEMMPTVEKGDADAVFPIAITEQRRATYDFSAPLLPTGGALFVLAPRKTPESLSALAGKTVTTPKTGPLAGYIKKNAPEVNLVVTANYEESLNQLISGKADAAALNFQVGAVLAAKLHPGKITAPDKFFLELPLALAVPKGKSAQLLKKLDEGISAIKADGTWAAINKKWLGEGAPGSVKQ